MPSRPSLASVGRDVLRRVGTRTGVTPFNLMTAEMIRRPEWLYRGQGRIPRGRLEFRAPQPVTHDDRALCRRLIDAYARATDDAADAEATTGMWAWIFAERQRHLAETLVRRDADMLAAMLAAMFRQEFIVGIAYGDLVRDTQSRLGARLWWVKSLDGLVSLAE